MGIKLVLKKNSRSKSNMISNSLWNDIHVDNKCETFVDKSIAVLLAFILLFGHFKGIFGLPLSSVVILAICPVLTLLLINCRLKISIPCVLLIIFMLYRTLMHNITVTEALYSLVNIIYVIAAINGKINLRAFIKTVFAVSIATTAVIIFQTVTHYLFGIHINFIPVGLLTDEIRAQLGRSIETGLSIRGGFYRPAGFFDEPSHFTQYVAPLMIYLLFSPNINQEKLRTAVFISMGVLLTTSGMGFALVAACWGGYFILKMAKINTKRMLEGLAGILAIAIIGVILFYRVEIIRELVLRIFGLSSMTSYNAIRGRTGMGQMMVSQLSQIERIFGTGAIPNDGDLYYTGMYRIILSYGLVGFLLYESVHVAAFLKMKNEFKWFSLYAGLMLIIGNTYSFQYRIFYFVFMFCGEYILSQRSNQQNTAENDI